MAETIIGKVMMTFRGEYDADTSYTYLDEVTYDGSTYLCRVDVTGILPTDTDHWTLLAKAGRDGKNGADGKDGLPGRDGKDGTPGKDGDQGPQGIPGPQGEPGVPGTNGKDGIDGKDGQPGKDGQNGITPHIDTATGNWFIGTTNTGVKAQGPAGQNGSDGKPGSNGSDGVSPHIDSATGHWFIGSTDTGVSARGPQGEQGSPGKDGVTPDVSNLAAKTDLANYYTKTETDTKLSTKADQAEYQTLNDKVSNMQIGGRNLLTGTQDWQGEWGNLSRWAVDDEKYKGLAVRKSSTSWWGLGQYYDSKPNTTYTFSFYAKASKPTDRFMDIFMLPSEDWNSPVTAVPIYAYLSLTTDWKRFSWTITTTGGGKIFPSVCSTKDGITIYVAGYKLEEGSVATDWTPAPEDFDTKLDAKADKSELVDYAKKSDLPTMPDLSGYATISSLIDYVKKTDLPDFTLFAKKSDIPVEQDLSNYAKKDDLNKYVTNETYSQNKTSLENTIQNLRTSLSNQNQVQTITSGTLADLANTQGSYHYEIECMPSDAPIQEWGLCDVVVGQHYAKQVFTVTGATDDNQGNVYVRVRDDSNQWHEWREITAWN